MTEPTKIPPADLTTRRGVSYEHHGAATPQEAVDAIHGMMSGEHALLGLAVGESTTLEKLRERRLKKHGTDGMWDWDDVVKRIEATGTSLLFSEETPETAINCNRCGDNDEELTLDQVIDKFCVGRPKPMTPKPVDHSHAIEQLRSLIEHDIADRHGEMRLPTRPYVPGEPLSVVSKRWWDHPSRREDIARIRSYIGAVKALEKLGRP